MTDYLKRGELQIYDGLLRLVEAEILPGLALSPDRIWHGLADLLREFAPRNRDLLHIRQKLQDNIDGWHLEHDGPGDAGEYKDFLYEIGYLLPEGADFAIGTENSDPEVSSLAGPQLVVPVDNARYALNAANARWGSLFDALYGTDVIDKPDSEATGYDPKRGAKVITYANGFLDRYFPLDEGSHADVIRYHIEQDKYLQASLKDGTETTLRDDSLYRGQRQCGNARHLLLCHHGLHVALIIDRSQRVGADNLSGVSDIQLESALTVIMDCEDSVAAVDGADKMRVYGNWLGLMKGDLVTEMQKDGATIERRLNPRQCYRDVRGKELKLSGRSLMLVRNVGLLMTTDAVLDAAGDEIPEGILDAVITSLCALHDRGQNSRTGSIYIVKPKMHGPDEAAFTNDLFDAVEDLLNLPRYSIKVGLMDEERRSTLNLKACIRAVKARIFFINTGFLDRTGDEIHTSMEAGPVSRKNAMKDEIWIDAYERWNVDMGLMTGMRGRAQIGKGMWAMPGEMAQMAALKGAQLSAGASCAWVPSPTAATLHAMDYHAVDVAAQQAQLAQRAVASRDDLLKIPLLGDKNLSPEDIKNELDNNAQGLLGYVVRWIDQGVGCSKVPDIKGTELMEDRATLRISSQHMANWLHHGICSEEQIMDTLRRMAVIVDQQNADDPHYRNMAPEYNGAAFQAACDLVFKGRAQPSGYTEPILHASRRAAKATLGEKNP